LIPVSNLSGIGIGREAIIIGGGHSAADFRYDLVGDRLIIGLNYHAPEMLLYGDSLRLDYTLYADKAFGEILESGYKEKMNTKIIAHKPLKQTDINKPHEKTDYIYTDEIIDMGIHSSFWYALQIVKDIFKCAIIYVVGIDGYFKNDCAHYYGDTYNGTPLDAVTKSLMHSHFDRIYKSINRRIKDCNNIFKCNKFSALQVPYKLPYGVA